MTAIARVARSSILVSGLAGLAVAGAAESALAAPSRACEGSGFALVLPDGQRIAGEQRGTVPAAALGNGFRVDGTYVEFTVRAASFGIQTTR